MYIPHLVKTLLYLMLFMSSWSGSQDQSICLFNIQIALIRSTKLAAISAGLPSIEARRSISGVVIDNTGAVVPNFSVEVWKIDNSVRAGGTAPAIDTVQTGGDGRFSFELLLGSYEICAKRFPASCRTVRVDKTPNKLEPLVLKINPADDQASSEVLDSRIRTIAGPHADDCGHVRAKESSNKATACALLAFKHHKAFYVRYDESGFDSEVAEAVAGDSRGNVYSVSFDSMGINPAWMPPGVTMPDGYHTKVVPCSQPVRLRKTQEGKLTCFGDGRWLRD
jgi:hypothetical protein